MHGDRASPSGGTRTVTVPASLGSETVYDEDQFAGKIREQIVYNGAEAKPVSKTVNVPWRSTPTAVRTINGDTVDARFTNTETTYTAHRAGRRRRARLAGHRQVERTSTTPTARPTGRRTTATSRVDRRREVHHATPTTATPTQEPDQTGASRPPSPRCRAARRRPAPTTSSPTTATTTTAPTSPDDRADVRRRSPGPSSSRTGRRAGGTRWQTVDAADVRRRPGAATSHRRQGQRHHHGVHPGGRWAGHRGIATTAAGAVELDRHAEVNPYWGSDDQDRPTPTAGSPPRWPTTPLGRVAKVWQAGLGARPGTRTSRRREYTYIVRPEPRRLPVRHDRGRSTRTATTSPRTRSSTGCCGPGRPRRRRGTAAATGSSPTPSTTSSAGSATSYSAHAEPGAPSGTLWWEPEWSVPARRPGPSSTAPAAPPAERSSWPATASTNLVEKWRTTTTYEGDLTTVTPPAGGMPTTTVTDVEGRTVELRQHTTASRRRRRLPGDQLRLTTARTSWSRWSTRPATSGRTHFDVQGRQYADSRPRQGAPSTTATTTSTTWSKTTDARGEVLWYVYDALGRKIELRDDSATGALRAEWKYDTLYTGQPGFRGQLTEAIRYEPAGSGNAYKWQVARVRRPLPADRRQLRHPRVEDGPEPHLRLQLRLRRVRRQPRRGYPAAPAGGGLVTEAVTTDYDATTGLPVRLDTSLTGAAGTMATASVHRLRRDSVRHRPRPGGVYVVEERDLPRRDHPPDHATGAAGDGHRHRRRPQLRLRHVGQHPQHRRARRSRAAPTRSASATTAWAGSPRAWTPGVRAWPARPIRPTASLGGPAPYWLDWTFDPPATGSPRSAARRRR